VAAFYQSLFNNQFNNPSGPVPKLGAQVLATALGVYVTNATLDPTTHSNPATQDGFIVSGAGLGAATFNVGSDGAAFGVPNTTTLTVLDLLRAADEQAVNGVLYNGDTPLRKGANDLFDALNRAGALA
jgi:hypothetical protein